MLRRCMLSVRCPVALYAWLAHALAGRGIVVVAMHPGWARTDMGGARADLEPADSVAGMLRVAASLGPEDSGRFFDWRGNVVPW